MKSIKWVLLWQILFCSVGLQVKPPEDASKKLELSKIHSPVEARAFIDEYFRICQRIAKDVELIKKMPLDVLLIGIYQSVVRRYPSEKKEEVFRMIVENFEIETRDVKNERPSRLLRSKL